MGIFPLLKGYFPEGSFVWLTFCYSVVFIIIYGLEIRSVLVFSTCRGIITAPSHAKLKVRYPPPPHGITAHAWGDPYAHTCTSLCSPNGQPAIQAKYIHSTLLPAFLFGCVVYASATLVTDFTRSL